MKYRLIDGYRHDRYFVGFNLRSGGFRYTTDIEKAVTFFSKRDAFSYMKEFELLGDFDVVNENGKIFTGYKV